MGSVGPWLRRRELAYLGEIVSIDEKKNYVGRATERRVGQPLGVFNNEARGLSYGAAVAQFKVLFFFLC